MSENAAMQPKDSGRKELTSNLSPYTSADPRIRISKVSFLKMHHACAARPKRTEPSPAQDMLSLHNSVVICSITSLVGGAVPQLRFYQVGAAQMNSQAVDGGSGGGNGLYVVPDERSTNSLLRTNISAFNGHG